MLVKDHYSQDKKIITDTSNKNKTENKRTVVTIPKANIKIVEKGKFDSPTHKYMTVHYPGFL